MDLIKIGSYLGVFVSLNVLSTPAAFNAKHCAPVEVKNETTSTLVRDHEDCNKFWVLPPDMGFVETTNFHPSGNLGFCSEMKSIQKTSKRISTRIGNLDDDIEAQAPAIRNAEKKLQSADTEYAKSISGAPILADVMEIQERILFIDDRLIELEEKITACKINCKPLFDDFRDLRFEKKDFNRQLKEIRSNYRKEFRQFERAKAKKISAERHLDFVQNQILDIVARKIKLKNLLLDMYKHYAALEGGKISLDYNSRWNENVSSLEAKYPNLNFSAVPTKDSRIHANFIGANNEVNYLSSLPMILDYSLAGFKYQPYGTEQVPQLSSLPSRFQGDLRISVVGGCPFYYKNFLDDTSSDLVKNPNFGQNKFTFGLTTTYKYPALFNFNVEASYNLYKFYKKVVKSGSKGGFFSKKNWKKVSETKIDKDTFKIHFLDESGNVSSEEKEKIRKTIKNELISRALQNMAEPAGARPTRITAMNTYTPELGALVLAKGLDKTCGWQSYYCKAGSWILKGLSSIFGSSRSEAEFKSVHDTTATEIWNEENVIWRPGASGYVAK